MNKEQEAKFDKWIGREIIFSTHPHDIAHEGWQACLEANGIGEETPSDDKRFRIGEAIEYLLDNQEGWKRGHVGIIPPGIAEANFNDYRPIPAWKPKDGEAVLFEFGGYVQSGVYKQGSVYAANQSFHYAMPMKPFDASKIGKPWSEI